MAQFSSIAPGTMANAGTSSRIAPQRKGGFFQRIGAGIESLVETAAPMISPQVSEFENLRINRQQIDQRQQQIDQNQQEIDQKQKQAEAENRPIFLEGNDSALRNLLPSEQKFLLEKARRIGIVQEDENGRPFTTFKDGHKALQELQNTPEEQVEINNVGIKEYNGILSNLNEQREREVNKIVKSMMKSDITAGEMEIREKVKNALEKGQLMETAEMRRIKADTEYTNKKIQGKREENQFLLGQGKGTASAFEEKVAALESAGALRPDAIKEIAGATQIVTNPVSGESFLYDKTTRTATPIDTSQKVEIEEAQGQAIAESKSPNDITLWEMVDLSTGVLSSIIATWNKTGAIPGQFVGLGTGTKTEFARSQSKLVVQDLANVLQRNPKFAEGERKWIIDNLDLEPKVFDTEEGMKTRLLSVAEITDRRLEQENEVINNKNLPKERRQHAAIVIDGLINFRKKLGVPEGKVSEIKSSITGQTGRTEEGFSISQDDENLINKYLEKK